MSGEKEREIKEKRKLKSDLLGFNILMNMYTSDREFTDKLAKRFTEEKAKGKVR